MYMQVYILRVHTCLHVHMTIRMYKSVAFILRKYIFFNIIGFLVNALYSLVSINFTEQPLYSEYFTSTYQPMKLWIHYTMYE